jgi:hypothetical protein
VADILRRVGDKWSVLVVVLLELGPRRFNEAADLCESSVRIDGGDPIVRRKSGELHSTAGEELLSANEYRAGPLLLQACKGRINVAIVLAYTTSTCHPIVEAPA